MSRLRAILADRLHVSALGVVLVLVLAVSYLVGVVLDQPLTRRPDRVTVQMTATGGLFEGSAVTYRGVKVGSVTDIVLTATGVEATVTLTGDERVPADSPARVRSLSPVGEQYLDFQPGSADGPFLEDGSVVPASSTDLPTTLGSTVVAVSKVLDQIDDGALRTLLLELSAGLDGTGDDLGRLVDQTGAILDDLDRVWPETDRLITDGGTVLDIADDNAGNLRELARSSRLLARFLRDYDPELERTLRQAPGRLTELETLVRDAQEVLPDFLSVGVSLSDVLVAHDPHLRALLTAYAPGLGVLAGSVVEEQLQIELIADKDPRCRYDVRRLDALTTERRPLQTDGRCSVSFSTLQRGAAHAPGPVR